jgi:hypothetical protein
MYYKWIMARPKGIPRPNLRLTQTGPAALNLYQEMYTSLINQDRSTLSRICGEGLMGDLNNRMRTRKHHNGKWTLHRTLSAPKVVANLIMIVPQMEGCAIRQAVVRLHTEQSLVWWNRGEKEPVGEKREVKEWVVVQKKTWKWKDEEWMVWGTTREADWKRAIEE